MHLGLTIFLTDRTISPDRLARAAEERGFESLLLPEHTHIPVDHPPHPGGEDVGDDYRRMLDPFVALTAAASVTRRLRVGTAITLVPQHDPIVLAKRVATLDHVSGGRFIFGVGYGWNRPEAEHHGIDFADRRALLREKLAAMQALWTQDVASFDGPHVRFAPSWAYPKPLQDPLPVLVGGPPSAAVFADVVDHATGWMPVGARPVFEHLPRLRERWEAAGRGPGALSVTVVNTRPDPARLADLAAAGVTRTVLRLPSAPEDDVLEVLDEYARLLDPL